MDINEFKSPLTCGCIEKDGADLNRVNIDTARAIYSTFSPEARATMCMVGYAYSIGQIAGHLLSFFGDESEQPPLTEAQIDAMLDVIRSTYAPKRYAAS